MSLKFVGEGDYQLYREETLVSMDMDTILSLDWQGVYHRRCRDRQVLQFESEC